MTTFSCSDSFVLQTKIEAAKLVRKIDKNKDGSITIDEFKEFFLKKARQAAKFAAAMKKKGVKHVDLLNDEIVQRSHIASPRSTSPRAASPRAASPRAASPRTASPRAVSPHTALQDEEQARQEFNTLSSRAGSPKSPKKALDISEVKWDDPASIAEFEAGVKAAARAGN